MNHELSDNQRRFLCRVLFLALCLVPTCATFYFAFHKPTPEQWAQRIHAELGIKTRIGSVETPLPNKVVFKRLRMYDAEDREFFNVLEAKVTLGDENQIQIDSPVQVSQRGLEHFLKESTDRVVRPRENFKSWRVQFADIEILSGEKMDITNEAVRFSPLNAYIVNIGGGVRAELRTPAVDSDTAHNNWVNCTLERGKFENQTLFSFNNSRADWSVPCWLFHNQVPQLRKQFGDRAGFYGFAHGWLEEGQPVCELNGAFVDVDLERYSKDFPRKVDKGDIIVENLLVRSGKWEKGRALLRLPDEPPIVIPNERETIRYRLEPQGMISASIRKAISKLQPAIRQARLGVDN